MDPNATLQRIADLIGGDSQALSWACADLYSWIVRGGFAPCWEAQPSASQFYKRWAARKRQALRRKYHSGYNG